MQAPRSAEQDRTHEPRPRLHPLARNSAASPPAASIDRATTLPFTFDGQPYTGLAGDTLASALRRQRRPPARPQLQISPPPRPDRIAGSEEPNALVELRTGARREPNIPATVVELFAGLEATEPEPLPKPPLRPHGRQRPHGPALQRRLLLQGPSCGPPPSGRRVLRTPDPPRRRPRPRRNRPRTPTTTPAATSIATCWWWAPERPA